MCHERAVVIQSVQLHSKRECLMLRADVMVRSKSETEASQGKSDASQILLGNSLLTKAAL